MKKPIEKLPKFDNFTSARIAAIEYFYTQRDPNNQYSSRATFSDLVHYVQYSTSYPVLIEFVAFINSNTFRQVSYRCLIKYQQI